MCHVLEQSKVFLECAIAYVLKRSSAVFGRLIYKFLRLKRIVYAFSSRSSWVVALFNQ